ncbi:TNT domain-containing protein [Blastopirellula sp. JC732]|uniref:TNT domain-containing protein n=1 Tax=Blastopirellula sediminis TaxID=2894196 RepID=A0A9X1SG89_9BACT|nr:TNT domain-containing protein [Blastopirellula sediminis]MCC9606768.1 TNT domain-containing protein [Blastopirellula sediminis]MCC9629935.1 TNT domain-containing protein [Blastopirellula sediminis]
MRYLSPAKRLSLALLLLVLLSACDRQAVVDSKWTNPNGSIRWPPDEGFAGKPADVEIAAGVQLERWGYPGGTFVSNLGVPPADLSLAPGTLKKPHYVYRVLKPLPALEGKAAPWFGQPGGGVQYDLVKSVEHWLEQGFLEVETLTSDVEQIVTTLEEAAAAEIISLEGGLPNEAHCLEQLADGTWSTYYSERGRRTGIKTFATEEEARDDLYSKLRNE